MRCPVYGNGIEEEAVVLAPEVVDCIDSTETLFRNEQTHVIIYMTVTVKRNAFGVELVGHNGIDDIESELDAEDLLLPVVEIRIVQFVEPTEATIRLEQ